MFCLYELNSRKSVSWQTQDNSRNFKHFLESEDPVLGSQELAIGLYSEPDVATFLLTPSSQNLFLNSNSKEEVLERTNLPSFLTVFTKSYIVYRYVTLQKNYIITHRVFSIRPDITSKFRTIAVFKSFVKESNYLNKTCTFPFRFRPWRYRLWRNLAGWAAAAGSLSGLRQTVLGWYVVSTSNPTPAFSAFQTGPLLLYSSNYSVYSITRLSGPRSRPNSLRNILRSARESNPGPLCL
jgi:hypothetical protein